MIEAYENMNDMEKVKSNFLWIFTVQETKDLKLNNQMIHSFLMKLEILVIEHSKHQKWKDIHIHQREIKNDQKQRCTASTSICPLKPDVFSRTSIKYCLLALSHSPSKIHAGQFQYQVIRLH